MRGGSACLPRMGIRACSQSFIVLLWAHKQAHAALKMRAKAGFGCAFCLACTRFCTKIRYKKDREQALTGFCRKTLSIYPALAAHILAANRFGYGWRL